MCNFCTVYYGLMDWRVIDADCTAMISMLP